MPDKLIESGQAGSWFRVFRALLGPLAGLDFVIFFDFMSHGRAYRNAYLDQALAIGYILLGLALGYRLVCSVGIDLLLAKAKGRPVPKILKHILAIVAALLGLLLSVNVLFSGAFAGLIALSSVIAVVIGLALRPIILDIFSGLSANLDSPFQIGD